MSEHTKGRQYGIGYKGAGGWTFSCTVDGKALWTMECRSIGMDKTEAHAVVNALRDRDELIEALRKAIDEADGWHDNDRSGPCPDLDAERALLAKHAPKVPA